MSDCFESKTKRLLRIRFHVIFIYLFCSIYVMKIAMNRDMFKTPRKYEVTR